jgi:hypothetical protein
LLFNTVDSKKVTTSNLNKHIRNTKTLIDLWEDEINRRKELNMEEMRLEKISDQGYYDLVQDLNYKNKAQARDLLNKNIAKLKIYPDKLELYDFKINEGRLGNLYQLERNGFKHKFGGYYKRVNFIRKDIRDNKDNEEDEETEDTFAISEISLNNNTRKLIKQGVSTKRIEDCYIIPQEENSIKKNLEHNYKLLRPKNVQKTKKIISHAQINSEIFYTLFTNFYSFRATFPNSTFVYERLKENLVHSCIANRFSSHLFYSNDADYKNFILNNQSKKYAQNSKRVLQDKLLTNHVGLSFYLNNYNQIKPFPEYTLSKTIKERNKETEAYLKDWQNIDEIKAETNKLGFLKTIKQRCLQFAPKNLILPSKHEVSIKIEKNLAKQTIMNDFDNQFFTEKYNCCNNIAKPFSFNFLNYKNEISPSTENKYKLFQTDNMKFDNRNIVSKIRLLSDEKELLKNLEQIANLTILSIEVFVKTTEGKIWNSESDEIIAIFCSVHDENTRVQKQDKYNYYSFIITTQENRNIAKRYRNNKFIIGPEFMGYKNEDYDYNNLYEIIFVKDEHALLFKLIEIFEYYDPDIVIGYDTELYSIGYIMRRANTLGIDLRYMLSRKIRRRMDYDDEYVKNEIARKRTEYQNRKKPDPINSHNEMKYMEQKFGKKVRLIGRVVFSLCKLLEGELKLTNYKIENVLFHVLKLREPEFKPISVYKMYTSGCAKNILFSLYYYAKRSRYNLLLTEELDFINKDVQFTKSKIAIT